MGNYIPVRETELSLVGEFALDFPPGAVFLALSVRNCRPVLAWTVEDESDVPRLDPDGFPIGPETRTFLFVRAGARVEWRWYGAASLFIGHVEINHVRHYLFEVRWIGDDFPVEDVGEPVGKEEPAEQIEQVVIDGNWTANQ